MTLIWQLVSILVACTSPITTIRYESSIFGRERYGIQKSPKESHDLIIGQRQESDQFMYHADVCKPWKWFKVIVVEETFSVDDKDNITLVRVLDKFTDGHGAYPELISGGPGYSNVTIKFTSQKGYGIDFLVEMYALVQSGVE